ncbi:hypothetical protein [Pseudomonas brassicacearum]|uniref:hypothetical protein n=1 Tax=Pseudomonas brassicacearum TaxID=930166 RepID=UPI001613B68C|nr:hypothetical protein [Pseudomonas brassicacearum]
MSTFVQLEDDQVIATFGCEQDPEQFPCVVEVENDDPRLVAYWDKWAQFGVKRPAE